MQKPRWKIKAANYNAHAGQVIAGNLVRGNDGKFSSGGGGGAGAADTTKPPSTGTSGRKTPAQAAREARQAKRQANIDAREQARNDEQSAADQARQTQADQNFGEVTTKLLGSDLTEALSFLADGEDPANVKPEYRNQLISRGLLKQETDGSYSLTAQANSFIRAAKAGDERKANQALRRAALLQQQRQAANAKRQVAQAKRDANDAKKREALAKVNDVRRRLGLPEITKEAHAPLWRYQVKAKKVGKVMGEYKRGTLRSGSKRGPKVADPKQAIAIALSENKETGNFTVFKQADGRYRWITFSSSGFEDRDKEIVPVAALQEDCDRADTDKDYGPLRWWHIPGVDIGDCDYNAMCGKVLVESGTFRSTRIAEKVKEHAADLAVSLGFMHPRGYPDSEGVFGKIRRKERSLLPRLAASNRLTGLVVLGKGNQEMSMLETKMRELWQKLGGNKEAETLVSEIVSAAGEAEKAALAEALRFKAAGTDPTTADPTAMPPEGSPEEEASETPEEEAAEPNPDGDEDDIAGNMPVMELHDMIDKISQQAMAKALEPIKAALQKFAGKEAASGEALVTALKELGTKASSLETKIAALESANAALSSAVKELAGEVPSGVRNRPTQSDKNVLPEGDARKEAKPGLDPVVAGFLFGAPAQQ